MDLHDEVLELHDMDIGNIECMDLKDGGAIRKNLDALDDIKVRIAVTMGFIEKVMKNRFDRELDRIGLTIAQVQVLIYILREQHKQDREITARELEQRFRVSNPTMSGILRRLEKKGIIERKPGSQDKRNKQIRIKADVEQLYMQVDQRVNQEKRRLFEGFTEDELEGLSKSLTKILHNLDQIGKEE